MRKVFILAFVAILMGAGVAVAAWPRETVSEPAAGFSSDEMLAQAYARIHTGMPASELSSIGFDITEAERLSRLALMEQYMPKDSAAFDALNPEVKACYVGPGDCNAFIFTPMGAQVLVLVQGGRVSHKFLAGVTVA